MPQSYVCIMRRETPDDLPEVVGRTFDPTAVQLVTAIIVRELTTKTAAAERDGGAS